MDRMTGFKGGGIPYLAPAADVTDVDVERGFAMSDFDTDPSVDGENPVGPGAKSLLSGGDDDSWMAY